MVDQQEMLEGLRDVILPATPSFWPPAVGWWIVMLIVVALCVLTAWLLRKRSRYKSQLSIVRQADEILNRTPHDAVRNLSVLVRKVAITKFPRREVAGLTGDEWLRFLDRSGNTDQFTQGVGRLLATMPYSSEAEFDVDSLHRLCRTWIETVIRESR